MDLLQVKTGDSFEWLFTDNVAGGLEGITVTAAVKTTGKATRALTVTEIDMENGQYNVAATGAETAQWPLGFLNVDLKYASGDVTGHTETFRIYVSEGITQ